MAAFVRPMDEHAVVLISEAVVSVYTAQSQSFRAMGKERFQASKDAVLEALADMIGVETSAPLGGARSMSRVEQPLVREAVEATPRRAISRHRRDLILDRQKRICPLCNKPLPSSEMTSGVDGVPGWTMTGPFEVDHVLPLELGGADHIDNMQALCRPCHRQKTRDDVRRIAKARRIRKREAGLAPKKRGLSRPPGTRYDWARGRYVRD